MNNNIIGIFDSGVGGLTVFSKLIQKLPDENYVYFGDTKNLPYGSKTQDELIKLAKIIFDFYAKQNAKAVVMACNTTSAVTFDKLKNDYDFKIYPVIQIASKSIAEQNIKKIGIMSTQATANSRAYKENICKYSPDIQVIELGCPGLVQIVEEETFDSLESIALVKKYFDYLLEQGVEKIVLGCTHYPYLRKILNKFALDDFFIDPSENFTDFIAEDLKNNKMTCSSKNFEPKFIVSSEPESFRHSAALFYELNEPPTLYLPNMI